MVIKLPAEKLQASHERLSQILNNLKQKPQEQKPNKPA